LRSGTDYCWPYCASIHPKTFITQNYPAFIFGRIKDNINCF
jgi:hypothetical protein